MTIDDPLPAPEPMDTPTTRPKLDLPNVIAQVRSIQTVLTIERMMKDGNDSGKKSDADDK